MTPNRLFYTFYHTLEQEKKINIHFRQRSGQYGEGSLPALATSNKDDATVEENPRPKARMRGVAEGATTAVNSRGHSNSM
jgi:hypothetical protein